MYAQGKGSARQVKERTLRELSRIANFGVLFIAVFRIGGGKCADQDHRFSAGVDQHVARAGGNENGITGNNLLNFSVDPRLARAVLHEDDFFHGSVAVWVASPRFSNRQQFHEPESDAFRFKNLVRN